MWTHILYSILRRFIFDLEWYSSVSGPISLSIIVSINKKRRSVSINKGFLDPQNITQNFLLLRVEELGTINDNLRISSWDYRLRDDQDTVRTHIPGNDSDPPSRKSRGSCRVSVSEVPEHRRLSRLWLNPHLEVMDVLVSFGGGEGSKPHRGAESPSLINRSDECLKEVSRNRKGFVKEEFPRNFCYNDKERTPAPLFV